MHASSSSSSSFTHSRWYILLHVIVVFVFLLLFIRAFLMELHHQTLRMEEQQLCHWALIQQQIINGTMLLLFLVGIYYLLCSSWYKTQFWFIFYNAWDFFFSAWLLAEWFLILCYGLSTILSILCAFFIGTHTHMILFHTFLLRGNTRTYPVSKKLVQLIYGICGWHIKQITQLSHKDTHLVKNLKVSQIRFIFKIFYIRRTSKPIFNINHLSKMWYLLTKLWK